MISSKLGSSFPQVKSRCDICTSTFKNLKKHIARVHENRNADRPEKKCHFCDKSFITKRDLKWHIVSNHDEKPKFVTFVVKLSLLNMT